MHRLQILAGLMMLGTALAGCSKPCCPDGEHRHVYIDGTSEPFMAGESRPADTDQDPNIVGDLSRWADRPFSHTPGTSILEKVNHERRHEGAAPLKIIDPELHKLALYKATYAAERGIDGHIGGSMGDAKCEGVGTTYGRFMSCCLNERGTACGAAMVQGKRGWYCCFLIK